jgi:hypothetical protein
MDHNYIDSEYESDEELQKLNNEIADLNKKKEQRMLNIYMKKVKENGHELRYLPYQTYELCLAAVEENGTALQYVDDEYKTNDLLMAAVKSSCQALKYIPEQTDEICLYAIKHNPNALEYITNQKLEYCLIALKKNGCAIKYIKDQTPELCLAAVNMYGFALREIKERPYDLCLTAVKKDGSAIKYVPYNLLNYELCLEAVKGFAYELKFILKCKSENKINLTDEQINDLYIAALNKNGTSLEYIANPTYELCLFAVKSNGQALKYVPNNVFTMEQTMNLCSEAVNQNGYALKYVKNNANKLWIKELCITSIKNKPESIEYVYNFTLTEDDFHELSLLAVSLKGYVLKNVINMTPEICLTAVKNYGWALKFAKDPSHELFYEALKNISTITYDSKGESEIIKQRLEKYDTIELELYKKVVEKYIIGENGTSETKLIYIETLKDNIDALKCLWNVINKLSQAINVFDTDNKIKDNYNYLVDRYQENDNTNFVEIKNLKK